MSDPHRGYLAQLFFGTDILRLPRCNTTLKTPFHPSYGCHNLVKEEILKSMAHTSTIAPSVTQHVNQDLLEMPSSTFLYSNLDQLRTASIDAVTTAGVDRNILRNPNTLHYSDWNVRGLHWWLARYPYDPEEDLILNNIREFRRYGIGRDFEVLCNFKKQRGPKNPSKYFWIHVNSLLKNDTYRRQLVIDYHWSWHEIEHDYHGSTATQDNIDFVSDYQGNMTEVSHPSPTPPAKVLGATYEIQPVSFRSYSIKILKTVHQQRSKKQ